VDGYDPVGEHHTDGEKERVDSGVDEVVGRHLSWGLGVQVDAASFGMGGIGGSLGAASRSGQYGISFLPAYMIDHGRVGRLERVLRECLGVPPLE
jgi:hypothetical protein